ncbi:hypothetical protein [Thalassobellus suaedae]|uniref:Uncharacterized protein n=1 Tax=Thalassobellus suaedae TaxID=3074124 RepID=A0ABY9XWQ9_9FLAO|nr:hypothetical protein RHP51_05025 [Flavobacteriaceae bacterium HL-DH14]
MNKEFFGIKTGNFIRIPIRQGHENLMYANINILNIDTGTEDKAVCVDVIKNVTHDDIIVLSKTSLGFKTSDGQVVINKT